MHEGFLIGQSTCNCRSCAFLSFDSVSPPCGECEESSKRISAGDDCEDCLFADRGLDICGICSEDRAIDLGLSAFVPRGEGLLAEAGCLFCTSSPEGTSRCSSCTDWNSFKATTNKKRIAEFAKDFQDILMSRILGRELYLLEEGEKKEMAQIRVCETCRYKDTGGTACGTCDERANNWVEDPVLAERRRESERHPPNKQVANIVEKEEEKRGMSKVLDGLKTTGKTLLEDGKEGVALATAQTTTHEFINVSKFALKKGLGENYPEQVLDHPIAQAVEPALLAILTLGAVDMFGDQMKIPKSVQKKLRWVARKTWTSEVKDNSQEVYEVAKPFLMALAEKAKDFVTGEEAEEEAETSQEAPALPRKGETTLRAEELIAQLREEAEKLERLKRDVVVVEAEQGETERTMGA